VPEQLLGGDAQVDVLLEAVVQKVLDDGRRALGDRRAVILHDAEERGHGVEGVVRWVALEQLDDHAADAPYVGRGGRAGLFDDLGRHPVRATDDGAVVDTRRVARDAEVGELDGAVLVGEDVGALDVAVDDTLIVKVHEAFENLGDVHRNEALGELAEALGDVVEGAILAESNENKPLHSREGIARTLR
jgi:hypothetical protein